MDKYFYHYLYTKDKVADMLSEYCRPMLKVANPLIRMKARKLLKYWKLIKDETFLTERIPTLFDQMTDAIDKELPNINYELTGRIKHLISALNKVDEVEDQAFSRIRDDFVEECISELAPKDEKTAEACRKSIYDSLNAETNNSTKERFADYFLDYKFEDDPFNKVRDFFAFRIIFNDKGKGDMIDELYKAANLIIDLINHHTAFDIVPSLPVVQTGKPKVACSLIHVPERTGLKEENLPYVKDYVSNPKQSGYQSLHIVIYDPYTDVYFELQLRTRSMDIVADTVANHTTYKKTKYAKKQQDVAEKIDYSKIHLANNAFRYFRYMDPTTGEDKEYIYDSAGITQPIKFDLESLDHLKAFIAQQ